jgi:hypothetical protein
MSLQDLAQVMSPPSAPVETGSPDEWPSIEQTIGTPLPADYKHYINTYGTGSIGRFLWPYNPFSRDEYLNLIPRNEADLDALRQLKERFGEEEVPYPIYPEPGGLLSWAISNNGDVLYWLTQGDPDAWHVVVNEARGPWYERFEQCATSFLTNLISGELESGILGRDNLQGKSTFQPSNDG